MLALLTQCLAEKIFARQHSGTQHRGLSECEPCTLFPLLQISWPPRAQPPSPPTLHTRTCSTHGRTCAHSHTQAARWVKCQESHLMKRRLHTNAVCLCRERPFYSAGQCLCWLSFVCTFLSTKSNRRNGGKKKSDRHAITATDMFRLIQALPSYLFNNFLFNNHAREFIWPTAYLMKIHWSGQPCSRWLAISHKQETFRSLAMMMIAGLS